MANRKVTVHASAAETATGNSGNLSNSIDARGIHLVLDVTAAAGTAPTLDVKVQRFDAASVKYVDLVGGAFAQKTTAAGLDDLVIYPGIAETANRSVSDVIGEDYRVVWTITGSAGQSFTFSVGATLLP